MKCRTIAQRLYFTLGSLIVLFLIGLGLTLWVEQRDGEHARLLAERKANITAGTKQMRIEMLQMSDAMRGMLLEPKNENERKRKLDADENFDKQAQALKTLLADKPELLDAINQANDFDAKTLNESEERVCALISTDIKAAAEYYQTTYLPLSAQEVKLLERFIEKADRSANQEANRAATSHIIGLLVVLGLIVFAVLIGRKQATIIQQILRANIATLQDVSSQVTLAASSITATSQSLAEGSSEQAASIEETSASLEEMTSMTKRNAENSDKANDLARQTRTAADKGVADIETMSAAMADIKNSSDDIAKIIRTIDEIAFQTNILALNAAVEAARAGEAGMGFAVVADEVRNLAQRSAQAAKETASKIESAISNTARGVDLSGKVAVTLNEIVAKAREMDELAAEVASASREQTQGISQVNVAVGQMDKVTQGNAASAEESAASAEELNAQAVSMKQTVNKLAALIGENGTATAAVQPQKFRKPAAFSKPTHFSSNGHQNGNGHHAESKLKESRDSIPLEAAFRDF